MGGFAIPQSARQLTHHTYREIFYTANFRTAPLEKVITMLSRVEELKLISQVALSDNRRAFARLVDAYQSTLRNFFLHLTAGDYALSDDLAQETFIKVYTNIRSFKGLSKFKTWTLRIAYNEFYSYTRKMREEREEEGYNVPDELSRDEEANEAKMDVYTAMRTLSETERTVITLFFIQDLPIKKIEEITGLAEGTIKSHISRGKAKMAKVLRPQS